MSFLIINANPASQAQHNIEIRSVNSAINSDGPGDLLLSLQPTYFDPTVPVIDIATGSSGNVGTPVITIDPDLTSGTPILTPNPLPDFYEVLLPLDGTVTVEVSRNGSTGSDSSGVATDINTSAYVGFFANAGDVLKVSANDAASGPSIDPVIAVFSSLSDDPVGFLGSRATANDDPGHFIGINDDGGPGLNSELNFTAPITGYYTIIVGQFSSGSPNTGLIDVTVTIA